MAKISYVNGRYVHHRDASVHIEDRGYQFADGVYEVIAFFNRTLLDESLHMQRLIRSLKAINITPPMTTKALSLVMCELVSRNKRIDGTLYLQLSRGVAKRDHLFPAATKASLVITVGGTKCPKDKEITEGVSIITAPDERWARRDIKAIALLPNVLAKQAAAEVNAREAWLVDEQGIVSEGAVSNAMIVNANEELITHPATRKILGGVTRDVVLKLARHDGIKVIERPFNIGEACNACEAFLTSTTSNVLSVVRIDGIKISNGKPGLITQKLSALYGEHIFRQTGKRL